MDIPISKLLIDFTNEYKLNQDIVKPIIQKLNQEFYIRIKDINYLTYEKWKKYKLPENLYNILKEKYNDYNKLPKTIKKVKRFINNLKIRNESSFSIGIKINKFDKIYQEVFNTPIDLDILLKTLSDLENEVKEYNIIRNIYNLLYDIIHNIFTYPNEEKYKNLNIKKILEIFPYYYLSQIFVILKFRKITNTNLIKFSKDIDMLTISYSIIINRGQKFNEDFDSNINQNK